MHQRRSSSRLTQSLQLTCCYFFVGIWEKDEFPKDWTLGIIVRIPKKGHLADCNNWRGETLLSIPSKVFCKVIIMRLENVVDTTLQKEQVGYRRGEEQLSINSL